MAAADLRTLRRQRGWNQHGSILLSKTRIV